MGLVYAEIELVNEVEYQMSRTKMIDPEEVSATWSNMLVDSGATMIATNETLQEVLKLPLQERRRIHLANGQTADLDVVGPVRVKFKGRFSVTNAFLQKGDAELLLGAIPMEEMDLAIFPLESKLDYNPNHPDGPMLYMK